VSDLSDVTGDDDDGDIDVGVDEPPAPIVGSSVRWTPSVHPKSFQESLKDSWSNAAVICSVHPEDPEEDDWEANLNK
jgi:hypothetical protein